MCRYGRNLSEDDPIFLIFRFTSEVTRTASLSTFSIETRRKCSSQTSLYRIILSISPCKARGNAYANAAKKASLTNSTLNALSIVAPMVAAITKAMPISFMTSTIVSCAQFQGQFGLHAMKNTPPKKIASKRTRRFHLAHDSRLRSLSFSAIEPYPSLSGTTTAVECHGDEQRPQQRFTPLISVATATHCLERRNSSNSVHRSEALLPLIAV
jgi:hypothetical protein